MRFRRLISWLVPLTLLGLMPTATLVPFAFAQSEQVVYNFTGTENLSDSNLISDRAGNLYYSDYFNTLNQFSAQPDGTWAPTALGTAPGTVTSLAIDGNDNIFGTTVSGGSVNATCSRGCGTIFEFSPPAVPGDPWTQTTIYEFPEDDGAQPWPVGITVGGNGILYGAAFQGGGTKPGQVFGLRAPAQAGQPWSFKVLYKFQGGADGAYPNGYFYIDKKGNLYSTTAAGGNDLGGGCGLYGSCGTVFELSPPSSPGGAWTKTTLYGFNPNPDGFFPNGGFVVDAKGNLYGTTRYGGAATQADGAVFELSPPESGSGPWTETVVHSFGGGSDGENPQVYLTAGPGGLYGTTQSGGADFGGTVFRVAQQANGSWIEQVIYTFKQTSKDVWLFGDTPVSNLVYESGALYGTTSFGGTSQNCGEGCGVLFQIAK